MSFTLRKVEKLRHKTLVDGVFAKGKTIYDYPLRLNYRTLTRKELDDSFRVATPVDIGRLQMMITVPKKKLKRAVDRVRMRRLIREAYRLNRHVLYDALSDENTHRTISMAFIYLHGEKMTYASVEKKMKRILSNLAQMLASDATEKEKTSESAGNR